MTPEEQYTGFGAAEVAYLLSRYEPVGAAAKSAELLRIDLEKAGSSVLASGASALLARGLARLDGDEVVLEAEAAVLAYALVAGTHWTEIGFMASRDQTTDAAVMIQAPQAVVLLQPRALGTWYLLVKDPKVSAGDAVRKLAEAFLAEHPGAAVFLGAHTAQWDATLFLRRDDLFGWELAKGAAPFWDEAAPAPATDAELDQALAAVLQPA